METVFGRFVSDEKVQISIPVVVGPASGLRRPEAEQAGLPRAIRERTVPLVVKEGVGMPPLVPQPRTPEDEYIRVAVVVVVSLNEVQPAGQALESGRLGPVLERTVPAVLEVPNLLVQAPGGDQHVQVSVSIEVGGGGATES